MDVSGLDLTSGRLSGVDDVRTDGEELVFSLSMLPGGDTAGSQRDDLSFVNIANLVAYPREDELDEAPHRLTRGLRDPVEMLSILASTVETREMKRATTDELLTVARSVGPLFGPSAHSVKEIREPISLWYWTARLLNYTVRLRDVEAGRERGIGLEAGLAASFETEDVGTKRKSLIVTVPLREPATANGYLVNLIAPELALSRFGGATLPLDNVRKIDDTEVLSYRFGRRGDSNYPSLIGCVMGRARSVEYCSSYEDEHGQPALEIPGGYVTQQISGAIGEDALGGGFECLSLEQRVASELLQAMVLFFTARVRLGWSPVHKAGGVGLSFGPTFSSAFERLWCCLGEWYPEDALRRCPHCGRVFSTRSGRTKTYCSTKCQIAEKSARQYRRTINKQLPRDVR